jgi:hypothetical protein
MSTQHNARSIGSLTENWAPWPSPYRAETDSCTAPEPRLSRHTIVELAPTMVQWFLDDDQRFGLWYQQLVLEFKRSSVDPQPPNLYKPYLCLIKHRFDRNDPRRSYIDVANEHDLANLHRAVWLLMFHGISRLLNYNLHGDWADPPGDATTQGRYDGKGSSYQARGVVPGYMVSFHTNPNYYGSYAIGSADIPAPDLGVESAPQPAEPREPAHTAGDEAATPRVTSHYIDVRKIGRALGRLMVDRGTLETSGQHPYHRVVKRYYFDHGDHTDQYAEAICGLLHPHDDERAAAMADDIGEDEVAEIHRCAWLFLTHRFSFVVGANPFGLEYGKVPGAQHCVPLDTELGPRVFEVPNAGGVFALNLDDVDRELTPIPDNPCWPGP